MVMNLQIRHGIISPISRRGLLVILAAFFLVALILILVAYRFTPPDNITMTTGFESGAYANYGERYRQILSRERINLHLLPSSGSVENLKRLSDKSFRVDAGFVQDGTSSPSEAKNLVSLGAIGYAPLWVFYQSEATFNDLSELAGMRIAIGPEGSGVRKFATDLLKVSRIASPPAVILDLSSAAANKALLAGTVDAVMMFGTEDNALVRELLNAPRVKLMNFGLAEAYTRLIPALSHVVLPRGILDVSKNMPAHDVHLLAVTTSLIVRKDLHPALIYLLLDAAVEIHGHAGWVNKKGEFPSPRELSFPSSSYAERFYKSGRPFLLDYLPFGIAAFVDRTLLIMIPLALILIPLIRMIPWLYAWWHRRKFYRSYKELKNLEMELTGISEIKDVSAYCEKIDRIEAAINSIPVPLAFFGEVYRLKEHIDLVRERLIRSGHPSSIPKN